jgi:PAS domain S-box-containing protein
MNPADSATKGARTRDALVEVDAHDRIVAWSPEAERLTGFRAATVHGRGFCELLEARDLWGNRACNAGLHESLHHREPLRPFLIEIRTAAGATTRIVIHPVPVAGAGRSAAILAYWLRPDLRRRRDRRRPVPFTELPAATEPRSGSSPSPLSPREIEVLRLLAVGTSTAAIAQRLGIAAVTVRNHVQRLLDRLGAHSRLEAVARARERGWLD